MNLNSAEFIDRLQNQDSEAIGLIIFHYSEALFKGALKMGLADDQAEDVVQSTWTTFISSVKNFQRKSHIRTFIFGIMYNKIKETWRSNKKYTEEFEDNQIEQLFNELGSFIANPMDPSEWVNSTQVLNLIQEGLHTLPDNQREAFYLKEVIGEETSDICNIMDISSTNLGVLIYRAKNNLRIFLEAKMRASEGKH